MGRNNYDNKKSHSKKSGAKEGTDKNGKHYVSCWRKGKNCGFVTGIFSEDENYSNRGTAERGKLIGHEWIKYRGQLTYRDQGTSVWVTAMWWPALGKLKISKFGLVASTKANNGGFFGESRKPKESKSNNW